MYENLIKLIDRANYKLKALLNNKAISYFEKIRLFSEKKIKVKFYVIH